MNLAGKINVLVAEGVLSTRQMLVRLLESDPAIRVAGAVADGQAAIDFIARHKIDVLLMDVNMPLADGVEATRRIMETRPLPIVVCSATSRVHDTAIAFRALEAGAIACIEKPLSRDDADYEARAGHLLETVKLMSEVKVVRRTGRPAFGATRGARALSAATAPTPPRLIGIGASTGGPPVLQTILAALPPDFPAPVLVVQHIAPGFLAPLVTWLGDTTGMTVRIASYGVLPLPGHVYLAPDDHHMGLSREGRIILSREASEHHVRPAVSFLFRALAQSCGADAVGVLLTGMGRDGAAELKLMRDAGAATIAQDAKSSVVHGMPGAAIALGGASQVLPANRIAAALTSLVTPPPAR
ncbi:MAG TPA: chemotaxis-specific protein-glutamate methyltransferase CheB [Ramlibacter sp.]|nr:chemotaxis-specific protein-glutamate methyltransferase CheB [Ramlibacter sp.]